MLLAAFYNFCDTSITIGTGRRVQVWMLIVGLNPPPDVVEHDSLFCTIRSTVAAPYIIDLLQVLLPGVVCSLNFE